VYDDLAQTEKQVEDVSGPTLLMTWRFCKRIARKKILVLVCLKFIYIQVVGCPFGPLKKKNNDTIKLSF